MSYCRWSSDDYTCDVYVYESDDGWTTHVAGVRVQWDERRPAPIKFDPNNLQPWLDRHSQVMDLLDEMPRQVIGLPHDGDTFVDETPGECAERLTSLARLGYNVPESAIAALQEEATE